MTTMQDLLFGEPDKIDLLLAELWSVPGWPRDERADRQFVAALAREFPSLDLADAVAGWKVWLLDHPEVGTTKKVNWRSRFRTWCKNGVRFARDRREPGPGGDRRRVGGTSPQARRGSTRPGTAEEFGPTRRLDDW